MLKQEDWSMEKGLAKQFYEYFGGDIHTAKQAINTLRDKKEAFYPLVVVRFLDMSKTQRQKGSPGKHCPTRFLFVEDIMADKGARMIAEKNVGA